MKRTLGNSALFLFSLLVCVFLGEVAIRALYPLLAGYDLEMWRYFAEIKESHPDKKLSFSHIPNRKGVFYGAEIATNSDGFRDREYPIEKPPDTTRLLFLGDSLALGWAVPYEKTIPKQLEAKLNEHGQQHFEVINLGVGNYNTTMAVELFKWKGLKYKPDMVVLQYFVNDPEPIQRISRTGYHIKRHSYMLAFLFGNYNRLRSRVDPTFNWQNYYASLYDEDSPDLADNRASLAELASICRADGIRLLIASYPDLHELKDYPFGMATHYIQGEAKRLGVPFLDLLPCLRSQKPEDLWVSNEDAHGNEKAATLVADAIYLEVVAELTDSQRDTPKAN